MKWFTALRDRKLNTATELLTTTSTQLATGGLENLFPNLAPVGPEIRIARDFMLAGQCGVIDRLHFRGQASRTYLTVIMITHSLKVAGLCVCEKLLTRFWMAHSL